MPAVAAPASSRASITTVEVTPPASTAHTPGPVPAPRRRYSRTCQAPPVTGPAGIILASPVEASTRPNTVRHRNRAPPAASSWRCAAVPPASAKPCAATAVPSQAIRSPPRWAAAARRSPAAPGARTAAAASTPAARTHTQARPRREAGRARQVIISPAALSPVPGGAPALRNPLGARPSCKARWRRRPTAHQRPSTVRRPSRAVACRVARARR